MQKDAASPKACGVFSSTREGAHGSMGHWHCLDTLERKKPMRVAVRTMRPGLDADDDVVGGSNPLKRPRRCGDAVFARGKRACTWAGVPRAETLCSRGNVSSAWFWKSQEGKAGREVMSLPDGGETLKGEPQERCDGSHRVERRQVLRGEKRQRRGNVKGAMGQRWESDAVDGRIERFSFKSPRAQAPSAGRFALPAYAEGAQNPMRGGSVCFDSFCEHTGFARGNFGQTAAVTGHALKGKSNSFRFEP